MIEKLKYNSASWVSQVSFMVNYFPYVIFILLINRNGNIITNALPLAIFYAFRRTALFIFRDLRKNSNLLGWLGLFFASIGYLIGIFGVISNILFDISAVFAGCAAAIFPASLNQIKRSKPKVKKKIDPKKALSSVFKLLILLAIFALISKFLPTFAFFFLFLMAIVGMFCYRNVYGKPKVDVKLSFNWKNLILVSVLFLAMLFMEEGRNQDIGTLVEWGIFLLITFLIILMLILIFDKQSHFSLASKKTYLQMMMYGVCAMFWITYSAVLVTIVYGANIFEWVFLAYIAGIILGKMTIKMIMKVSPFDVLTTNSIFIILGIMCTFWLPSYFIGIFLIRVFANNQKQIALQQYEQESGNYQDSYYLSYYLTSLSAFWTQAIMWATLIICSHSAGFNNIIHMITFHQIASKYMWSIHMTHVVLATVMILFVILTYCISKKEDK